MRLTGMIFLLALAATGQVVPFDPEYVIPKENPDTTPADLKNGQQLFMGQCARCHGPKGEGGRGAVLAQPRLRHAPDDEAPPRPINSMDPHAFRSPRVADSAMHTGANHGRGNAVPGRLR